MEAYELAEGQMELFLISLLVRVGSLLSTLMCHVLQRPHLLLPGKKSFEKESEHYVFLRVLCIQCNIFLLNFYQNPTCNI